MPAYQFRYFVGLNREPVLEAKELASDAQAIAYAAAELLRMPGRTGVEAWAAERLVYARRRRCGEGASSPALAG